jgi:hypothetical protein
MEAEDIFDFEEDPFHLLAQYAPAAGEEEGESSPEASPKRGGNRKQRQTVRSVFPGEAQITLKWVTCPGCVSCECIRNLDVTDFPRDIVLKVTRRQKERVYDMYAVWLLRHLHAAGQLSCPCGGVQYISQKANQPALRCYQCKRTLTITGGCCFFKGLNSLDSRGALVFLFAFVSGASLHFAAQIGKFHENSKQPRQLAKRFSELCVGANAREYFDARDGWREMEADECAVAGKRKYHKGRRARLGGIVWVAGAARIHYGRVQRLVARVVHKRSKEELGPLLLWLLENDGVLRTDCWRGYSSLTKTAALHGKTVVHKTVNHSRTFKAEDGTHTNRIEGMWRVLRWEVKRRWSALGVSEMKVLSARVQFGVWVINRRLAHKHDNKEDTLFQAMMQLLLRNDLECPPHLSDSSACGYGLERGAEIDLQQDSSDDEVEDQAKAAALLHDSDDDAESSDSDTSEAPQGARVGGGRSVLVV